jgi:hypothetical protein
VEAGWLPLRCVSVIISTDVLPAEPSNPAAMSLVGYTRIEPDPAQLDATVLGRPGPDLRIRGSRSRNWSHSGSQTAQSALNFDGPNWAKSPSSEVGLELVNRLGRQIETYRSEGVVLASQSKESRPKEQADPFTTRRQPASSSQLSSQLPSFFPIRRGVRDGHCARWIRREPQ